jgi:predicted flap endonuclease-1-like 5' DNA nuclease
VVFLIAQTLIFLLLAMVIGVIAGWMLFGGRSTKLAESEAEQQVLEAEMADVREMLGQREADVTRLRGKLRLAATELEKRANQVSGARRAHAELSGQFDDMHLRLADAEAERLRLQTLADDAVNNPTLWASEAANRNVEAALSAKDSDHRVEIAEIAASHEEKLRDLEQANASRLERLQTVVDEKESAIVELQKQLVVVQDERSDFEDKFHELGQRVDTAETETVRVLTESKNLEARLRQDIQQREIELSSARLRSESARNELGAITMELVEFRKRNTELLQDSHNRLSGLTGRVETAHSILSGQSGQSKKSPAANQGMVSESSDDLLVLPGMTAEIASHLRELEVKSLADVASWTDADIKQYETWLPDHPGIISANDWVSRARSAIAAKAATAND